MGAYTCQYGVVHKMCRCPKPHTISCDKPEEHKDQNYVPKHRKDPVVRFRITVMESERGWGRNEWTEDFDTREEARDRINFLNEGNKPGPAPDYYIQAYDTITEVTL